MSNTVSRITSDQSSTGAAYTVEPALHVGAAAGSELGEYRHGLK